jgi:hypothetical protein
LVFFIGHLSSASRAYGPGFKIAARDDLALVADAMYRNNPAIFREKPEHAGVQFSHVAQFKETVAKGTGQRTPVILPVTQFYQASEHRREIPRITGLQFVQKFLNGRYSVL